MRLFWAILQKEISGYFKSGTAYALFLAYVGVSVLTAFYYGEYLTMHDAALYALFIAQPVILAAMIPALSMRTWAEEYKAKTDEFLLTQPLPDYLPVTAKFAAVFILLSGMILSLILFVYYTSTLIFLDFANVVCCFIGVELCAMLLGALGCLVSCLSRQLMMAYLFGVLLSALWLWLPFGHFYDIYKNFLYGEIGLIDVCYFVLMTGGLLWFNVLALKYKRSSRKYRYLKFGAETIIVSLGIFLALFACHNLMVQKFDVTTADIYTLKSTTRDIIKEIKEPLIIEVFAAEDYLKQKHENRYFFEQISRFLHKYQNTSKGMIELKIATVKAFSETENNILRRGLYYSENAEGSRNYFGAFIKKRDGAETVIKQFLPQRFAYVEKDIDTAILKLIKPEMQKKIAVYLDKRQNLEPLEGFFLNLENDYIVADVPENAPFITPEADLLILLNPKKLPELFLYAVDQYVMNGGKLLVFLDLFTRRQSAEVNEQNVDMAEFLAAWGVRFMLNPADEGKTDKMFLQTQKPLQIDLALQFNINNSALNVVPFIVSKEGYVGAVIEGKLNSHYSENPFADTNPSLRWLSWRGANGSAQIALVGDADILDDDNWIDEHSDDKNPYSLLTKASNVDALRALIDYMSGNKIYMQLPLNHLNNNEQNIATILEQSALKPYKQKFAAYEQKLSELKAEIYQQSGGNIHKLRQILRTGTEGQNIAKTEQKIERLNYLVKQHKNAQIYNIMITYALLIPLALALLLFCGLRYRYMRRKQRLKEQFDD